MQQQALQRYNYSSTVRRTAGWLLVALAALAVQCIGGTQAYFTDTESSQEAVITTSVLDFDLSKHSFTVSIGMETGAERTVSAVVAPQAESLDMQYVVSASSTSAICGAFSVRAKHNEVEVYSGSLAGFVSATTTDFGVWSFEFDLPVGADVTHGDVCAGDIAFHAWREGVADPYLGFFDTELLAIELSARTIVLNEIFPRPGAGAAPNDREYIELYNNGSESVDVIGWNISQISGSSEMMHEVVASGAASAEMQPYNGASTNIAPGGFLILEFGGGSSRLNDGGDIVRLYDAANELADEYAYPSTAAGKAHVRFPDGIGIWIDPEPTPGAPNEVSIEDMRAAGLDEALIEMLLDLMRLRDSQLVAALAEEEVLMPDPQATSTPTSEIITSTPLFDDVIGTSTPEMDVETGSSTPQTDQTGSSTPSTASDETKPVSGGAGVPPAGQDGAGEVGAQDEEGEDMGDDVPSKEPAANGEQQAAHGNAAGNGTGEKDEPDASPEGEDDGNAAAQDSGASNDTAKTNGGADGDASSDGAGSAAGGGDTSAGSTAGGNGGASAGGAGSSSEGGGDGGGTSGTSGSAPSGGSSGESNSTQS